MPATENLNGVSTTNDTAVTLIAASGSNPGPGANLTVINESGAKVFISLDGGSEWFPIPAGTGATSLTLQKLDRPLLKGVLAKRFPGGTNATGLYAYTF